MPAKAKRPTNEALRERVRQLEHALKAIARGGLHYNDCPTKGRENCVGNCRGRIARNALKGEDIIVPV